MREIDPWTVNDEGVQRGKPLRARCRARELEAETPRPFFNYHAPVPEAYREEHERRIQAQEQRVQRELAERQHEPDDPVDREAQRENRRQKVQRARLKLLAYLAENGGRQTRKAIRAGLHWQSHTLYETATGPWFAKTYYEVSLTVEGWQAAREQGVSK